MSSVGLQGCFLQADDIIATIDTVAREHKELMELLLGSVSHIERLENTGRLSKGYCNEVRSHRRGSEGIRPFR